MTEAKSSTQNNQLISFICSLPFWWLGIMGYQAAMLPSKNPVFIGLYSWEKVIGLISIIVICVIGIKFVHPKLTSWMKAFLTKLNFSLPSPYLSFVCLFCIRIPFHRLQRHRCWGRYFSTGTQHSAFHIGQNKFSEYYFGAIK